MNNTDAIVKRDFSPIGDVPQIFADGYEGVTVQDLILRLNLVANHVTRSGELEPVLVGRLVLSLPAFLRIYEGFKTIVQELESKGVIRNIAGEHDADKPS